MKQSIAKDEFILSMLVGESNMIRRQVHLQLQDLCCVETLKELPEKHPGSCVSPEFCIEVQIHPNDAGRCCGQLQEHSFHHEANSPLVPEVLQPRHVQLYPPLLIPWPAAIFEHEGGHRRANQPAAGILLVSCRSRSAISSFTEGVALEVQRGELRGGVDDALEVGDGHAAPPQPEFGQPWEHGGGRRRHEAANVGGVQRAEGLGRKGAEVERGRGHPVVVVVGGVVAVRRDNDGELLGGPRRRAGEQDARGPCRVRACRARGMP